MNNPTNDEPAFPRDDFHDGVPGMSLRDWFAGQALAGLGVWSPKGGERANVQQQRAE